MIFAMQCVVLKETRNVLVKNCDFSLRYPLWHARGFELDHVSMDELTRAAIWYSYDGVIKNTKMDGIKAVRECENIRIEDRIALVSGGSMLSGTTVTSTDLRGGAALVMAGLVADGYTTVSQIHHIMRGYEHFTEKLQGLGAHVELLSLPDPEEDDALA
mgnify:CR=1 FL=1